MRHGDWEAVIPSDDDDLYALVAAPLDLGGDCGDDDCPGCEVCE